MGKQAPPRRAGAQRLRVVKRGFLRRQAASPSTATKTRETVLSGPSLASRGESVAFGRVGHPKGRDGWPLERALNGLVSPVLPRGFVTAACVLNAR